MPLSPGDKFGPYLLIAPIGKGGMGEVWKARDTRLDRIVAMKFSQEKFSERFEREAKAIGALNHPNICTLHDVGPNYLVMEYIEGTPLKGPLPVDQALKYAVQICAALDHAHNKGFTHRDLKPANILVTKAGIKLLDFGLAKLASAKQVPKPDDATLTMALTGKNEIVGTLYYMSPEQLQAQANGQEIDGRSDIFSFGIVLYEMLTGKRAFEGASPASVIAAIMERPAPSITDVAPAALDWVLKRCLAKDPDERWQTARDLKAELERIASAPESGSTVTAAPTVRHRSWLPWCIAGFLLLALMPANILHFREKLIAPADLVRLEVLPPTGNRFSGITGSLSPDGRHLAFEAFGADRQNHLWVRDLTSLESRLLPYTEDVLNPFWSPDSRFLAFYANGRLKKIEAFGGPVTDLCAAAGGGRGGSWNRDGVIIFGGDGGIMRVSANGGDPVPVTKVDKSLQEVRHARPEFLPDGVHFLYVRSTKTNSGIYIGSLDATPENQITKLLLRGEVAPRFTSSRDPEAGYVLFMREQALMAQGFDISRLELVGEPVQVADPVNSNGIAGAFSVSGNGILSYVGASEGNFNAQLEWYDRQGKVLGTVGQPGLYRSLTISRDGSRVAVDRSDVEGSQHIWIFEFARNVSTRLTSGKATNGFAAWSPDGRRLAFRSTRNGTGGLYSKPVNGMGAEQLLLEASNLGVLTDWSRDGRFLLFSALDSSTRSHLWVFPVEGSRKAEPLSQSEFSETQGRFSPDSHWIAFTSNESGVSEVYVQSFPASSAGGKWIVSVGGGTQPHWRGDGKELYYLSGDDKFMAADITTSPAFKSSIPKQLFRAQLYGRADQTRHPWDVTPDGNKFLLNTGTGLDTAPSPITIVLNWQAALKK